MGVDHAKMQNVEMRFQTVENDDCCKEIQSTHQLTEINVVMKYLLIDAITR